MVTVKGGRVEPAAGLEAATILAKFNDVIRHRKLPDFHLRCRVVRR
jgi:hypothetical protein